MSKALAAGRLPDAHLETQHAPIEHGTIFVSKIQPLPDLAGAFIYQSGFKHESADLSSNYNLFLTASASSRASCS